MGKEFRCSAFGETRRLLWLMGIVFAILLIIQYFELPYGGVLSSLLSAGKVQVASGSSMSNQTSSTSPRLPENLTFANGSVPGNPNIVHEVANMTKPSDGKDEEVKSDSELEKNESSDGTIDMETDPEDESISKDTPDLDNNPLVEEVGGNVTSKSTSSPNRKWGDDIAPASAKYESSSVSPATLSFALPPAVPPPHSISPENIDTTSGSPVVSVDLNTSSVDKDIQNVLPRHNEKPGLLEPNVVPSGNNSSMSVVPVKKKNTSKPPPSRVVPISEMNNMLLQSQASYHSMKPRWSSALDQELLQAKALIENGPAVENEPGLYATLFRNVSMFKRSYELMERTLKVYIYTEGQRPVFNQPVLEGIYASEGWFMKLLKANKKFVTKNPKKAHLFSLPFSSRRLKEFLYVPNSHSRDNMVQFLSDYLYTITSKYPFWNRTGGADHFLVACHDWAPAETKWIMAKCIRALCNADLVDEGFQFGKDVSLPETYVRSAQNPLSELGGKPPSKRHILAFFAGNVNHGYLRPILLKYWENKDPDMKIFGWLHKAKGQMNYIQHMKSSKYCICAKGYEVHTARVVEAIFYECVPVIISDNYVPPFFETLNWESFAVFVLEKDIPNLKNILLSIPQKRYLEMQRRVKQVQKHFLWHPKPVKYDIFHMILHSIWYTRVFQIRSG